RPHRGGRCGGGRLPGLPGGAAGGERRDGAVGAWLRHGDGLIHYPALQRPRVAAHHSVGRGGTDGVDGLAGSAGRMSWRVNRLTVDVQQGDLTIQDVDAIVNAANNDLELGGGVRSEEHTSELQSRFD